MQFTPFFRRGAQQNGKSGKTPGLHLVSIFTLFKKWGWGPLVEIGLKGPADFCISTFCARISTCFYYVIIFSDILWSYFKRMSTSLYAWSRLLVSWQNLIITIECFIVKAEISMQSENCGFGKCRICFSIVVDCVIWWVKQRSVIMSSSFCHADITRWFILRYITSYHENLYCS